MNVCYREATVEDAAGIANVEVVSQQSAYREFLPATHLDSMSISDRTQPWQSALQSDDADRTVVALHDTKVIGFVRAGKCSEAGVGGITYLFVLSEYWGTGVCKMLYELRFLRETADYRMGRTINFETALTALIMCSAIFRKLEVEDDSK